MSDRPVHVTGGSGGIAADCAAITAIGGRFGAAATDTAGAALTLHGYLAAPPVLTSSLLDPAGFAAFEGELLWALDGWQGLSWVAAGCAALDAELRAAANAYASADELGTDVHDLAVGVVDFGPALYAAGSALADGRGPLAAAEAVVARDPELADALVDALGVPGMLTAIAHELPDGHGVLRHPGVDRGGVAGRPPRRLTDLLLELARRDGDTRHGAIDVRVLTMRDGSRRAIVDITGTKSWDPLPTGDVTSLTTNGRALVGARTAYEEGVLAALRQAGVRPTDDVMLVGHSEGGMVAVTAARDAVRSGAFRVTHVITAGSPIGRTVGALPGSVKVLALENAHDVVPHLDGIANPDRPNVTTASSARGDGTVIGDHGVSTAYVSVADDVQRSRNASIRDFLRSARGYLQAEEVVTHTYQVQREY